MADELAQFIPGDTPGTIRGNYDPDFVAETAVQGRVRLIPIISDDGTTAPLTARVIASYDRELVNAGRSDETMKTYRKVWNRFSAAFSHLPTDRDLILDYLGNFNGPTGRTRLNHHAHTNDFDFSHGSLSVQSPTSNVKGQRCPTD